MKSLLPRCKSGYQTCTANQAIKALQPAIDKANLTSDLIIHTDRGGCFTSHLYYNFIKSKAFVVGSMTDGAKPWQNAVVERLHRSSKSQHKGILKEWPKTVKTTRDFQIIVEKNRILFNEKAPAKKNMDLSPNTTKRFLLKDEHNAPQPCIMVQNCNVITSVTPHQDNEDIEKIKGYKYLTLAKESRSLVSIDKDEYERQLRDKQLIASMDQIKMNQGMIIDTQDYHEKTLEEATTEIKNNLNVTKQILEIVKPKKKPKYFLTTFTKLFLLPKAFFKCAIIINSYNFQKIRFIIRQDRTNKIKQFIIKNTDLYKKCFTKKANLFLLDIFGFKRFSLSFCIFSFRKDTKR